MSEHIPARHMHRVERELRHTVARLRADLAARDKRIAEMEAALLHAREQLANAQKHIADIVYLSQQPGGYNP